VLVLGHLVNPISWLVIGLLFKSMIKALEKITDLLFSFLCGNETVFGDVNKFYFPLKEYSFFNKNKLKIVRFISDISPWIVLPYTLLAFSVWVFAAILFFILSIVLNFVKFLSSKLINFKVYWKNL